MRWSISRRLSLVAFIVAVGVTGQTLFNTDVASDVHDAAHLAVSKTDAMMLVEDMRRANLSATLVAMDTIVDKDAGEVPEERVQEAGDSLNTLRDGIGRLKAAAPAEMHADIDGLEMMIADMASAIQVDLFGAVTTKASDEEFGRLDDHIDGTASEVDRILEGMSGTFRESFDAAERSQLASVDQLRVNNLAAGALLLIGLLGGLYAVGRSITRPIAGVCSSMEAIARDELTSAVPGADRTDEVGTIARALATFRDRRAEQLRLEAEAAEKERLAAEEKRRMLRELSDRFEQTVSRAVDDLETAASRMEGACSKMVGNTSSSQRRASSTSATASQLSGNVQTVAATVDQLVSSVHEIASQMNGSSQVVSQAATAVEHGMSRVGQLVSSAERIGAVVSLIQSIAAQTNLLALNATIEAARAGEAGKGFAVVANEVKTLASQTAKATEEIGGQVEEIQAVTNEVAEGMRSVAQVINNLRGVAASVSSSVEQQSAATQEIGRAIGDAANGIDELNQEIGAVAQEAGSTEGSARSLSDEVVAMRERLEQVKRGSREFVAEIAA